MNFAYLNPFTVLRWMFWGKNLDEILDFDKKRQELNSFHARTKLRMERAQRQIDALAAQTAIQVEHMEKAKMTSENLLVLMTQSLGMVEPPVVEPPVVEPTPNNEA